jgi:hypothetical protein
MLDCGGKRKGRASRLNLERTKGWQAKEIRERRNQCNEAQHPNLHTMPLNETFGVDAICVHK